MVPRRSQAVVACYSMIMMCVVKRLDSRLLLKYGKIGGLSRLGSLIITTLVLGKVLPDDVIVEI